MVASLENEAVCTIKMESSGNLLKSQFTADKIFANFTNMKLSFVPDTTTLTQDQIEQSITLQLGMLV